MMTESRIQRGILPYTKIRQFMSKLRARKDRAADSLEFLILTAARIGEVVGATWEEIDLDRRTWVTPGARRMNGREHWVPLSDATVGVLKRLENRNGQLFPKAS
jgi:integrase